MKNKRRFLGLIAAALLATSAWAQMTFTYSVDATESTLSDGSTLVQLASGTNLNGGFISGVKVNGVTVDAANITPNPITSFKTDGEIETYVYDGKAYSFRFIEGEYFTMVVFSDPHVDDDNIKNSVATKAAAIAAMGTESGKKFTFDSMPSCYVPTADIVFCLGDLDANRKVNNSERFTDATSVFKEKGIPFITLAGNHDIEPDYYNDGTYGMTSEGKTETESSLNVVKDSYTTSAALENGIADVQIIKDSSLGSSVTQMGQFTFTFEGIRFYCASSYWWQKPYSGTAVNEIDLGPLGVTPASPATYYSAEGTINALKTFVETDGHEDEPSVWLSHYPFVAQSDNGENKNERWWLDQNYVETPVSVLPSGSSQYYTDAAYTTDEGKAVADLKKKTLADIIVKTKNPVHFSGHAHINALNNYTANDNKSSFADHTIRPFTEGSDNAFIVLCKKGVGVVEVKTVTF